MERTFVRRYKNIYAVRCSECAIMAYIKLCIICSEVCNSKLWFSNSYCLDIAPVPSRFSDHPTSQVISTILTFFKYFLSIFHKAIIL